MSSFDIDKIARLSRIKVEPQQHDEIVQKFSTIVEMIDHLQQVDTSDIQPLSNPLELLNIHQRQRPDQITEHDQHEKYQAVAPKTKNGKPTTMSGLYLVPAVIE